MRLSVISSVALAVIAAGCSHQIKLDDLPSPQGGASVIRLEQLPVYGADPLSHTLYLGSDASYHYFAYSRGIVKAHAGNVAIPTRAAKVEPATFPFDGKTKTFVQSKGDGVVTIFYQRPKRL